MIIAIIIALTGTIILNLGFVFQKSEVGKLPTISLQRLKRTIILFLCCKKWLLGTGLTFFGWSLFLIAISLAPLSLIAPLNNVGVVILVIIAYLYLKEKLVRYEYLAFLLVIMGVLLISLSFHNNKTSINVNNFEFYLLIFLILMFLVITGIIHLKWLASNYGIFLGIVSGITGGLGAVFTKTMTLYWHIPIEFLLYLLLFLICQSVSFITLQSAFQKERTIIVVPLFNSFSTIIPLIIGIFAFSEIVTIVQYLGIISIIIGSSALFRFNIQQTSIGF